MFRGAKREQESLFFLILDYCAEEVLNTLGVEAPEKRRDFLSVVDSVRNDRKFALHSCTPLYHGIFTETLNTAHPRLSSKLRISNTLLHDSTVRIRAVRNPLFYTAKDL